MTMPPLMLFAAGFGTRMGALTQDRPKPLVKVAGKALIDHALALAAEAGSPRIVANLHYLPHMIEAHLDGTGVHTIRETPDILETGGGLRNALPALQSDTVMTLNTDAVWAGANPLTALAQAWDPDRMDALLLCVPTAQAQGHKGAGDFDLHPDGQIVRGPGYVYTGAHILKAGRLAQITEPAFSLNVAWNEIAADGRLFGLAYTGHWCDVGHPGGITDAEEMLARHDV